MKIRKMLLGVLFAVASLAAIATLAEAQKMASRRRLPVRMALKCHNYGGQQDIAKNPDIINSSQLTLQKGKTLYWQSTDGDKGSMSLDYDLAPGDRVGVTGKPGQSYTCSAWILQ